MEFIRKFIRVIFLIVVVVSFAVFLQNDSVLELKLLFWKREVTLYFLTGSLFLCGFLVGFMTYFLMFKGSSKKPNQSIIQPEGIEGKIVMPPDDTF